MESSRSPLPESLILALAILSSFALVVGGLWFLQARDSRTEIDSASPTTASPPTSAPSAPTTTPSPIDPPPTAPPAAVEDYLSECPVGTANQAVICELVHFVETVRGRPFKTFPRVEVEENAAFDARLLTDFDDDTDDLWRSGETLRSLGLIEPDADLVELYRAILEVGVVGFYRTETAELVVRGGGLGLYEQSVLVHELVHAFDDQWFGLDRPEFDDDSDESSAGFTAIVEGNASRVEDLWVAQLDDDEKNRLRQAQATALSPSDVQVLQRLPRFLLQLQISPYTDGLALVEAIEAQGGETAVDSALENPPVSTEQVLHLEDYFSREPVLSVDAPRASGPLIDEGVFGELGLRAWLGVDASDGWGGDRYLTYANGDNVCTQVNFVMDSPDDREDLRSAALLWTAGSDRTQRTVEEQGATLILVGCVAAEIN